MITSPLSRDGTLTLWKGDSYALGEGREIVFVPYGSDNWPTDLTGYSFTITINDGIGQPMLSGTLTLVSPSGETQAVQWEPTATDTETLTPGTWSYEVKAIKGTEAARLAYGLARVRQGTT